MARLHATLPDAGAVWTDEDRMALAADGDAFRRGVACARRALERETPTLEASIAVIRRIEEFIA